MIRLRMNVTTELPGYDTPINQTIRYSQTVHAQIDQIVFQLQYHVFVYSFQIGTKTAFNHDIG